jgi:phosphatidate cytidylyltransferase
MAGNLQTRIITALVLGGALFAVVLLLPPNAIIAVLTALVLMGAWEWSAFLRTSSVPGRAAYVLVIAVLLPCAWYITAQGANRDIFMLTTVVWWFSALCWILLAPRRVARWSAALAGVLALVPAWLALARMRIDLPRGEEWILFAFVLVWMADIGGYFFGRRLGRTRLAPSVSPGKTWEGVLGGFVLSAAIAIAASAWFELPMGRFLALCLAVVAYSIVGDLTESLLKRYAGMKDSGTIFPGHGGVMDRIDSVTAAAPVLYFGLTTLGLLA